MLSHDFTPFYLVYSSAMVEYSIYVVRFYLFDGNYSIDILFATYLNRVWWSGWQVGHFSSSHFLNLNSFLPGLDETKVIKN